jgi:hypothetical protein
MFPQENTYCKVGVIPLGPWLAAGVAAGVAGVTAAPFALCWPLRAGCCAFPELLRGGVNSWEAPGNDKDPGAVKALA